MSVSYIRVLFVLFIIIFSLNACTKSHTPATDQPALPSVPDNPFGEGQGLRYTINDSIPFLYSQLLDTLRARRNTVTGKTTVYCNTRIATLNYSYTEFQFGGTTKPGVYTIDSFRLYFVPYLYLPTQPMNVTITEYGSVGEFIGGYFSGLLRSEDNALADTLRVSSVFRIKRQ